MKFTGIFKTMRFSLSAKLALLFMAGLISALALALAVTYVHVGESALRADRENFMGTLRVMEENITAGFMFLSMTKLNEVTQAKERLRGAARRFSALLAKDGESGAIAELRRELEYQQGREGLILDSFLPASLEEGPRTKLGLYPELTDFKGQSLREAVAGLPAAGKFKIYRLPGHGPMLVYFLPALGKAQGEVAVGAISIQSLEDEAEESVQAIARTLERRINSLALYPNGFIALLDSSGAPLAGQGVFASSEAASLAPLLEQARAPGASVQEGVLRVRRTDGTEEDYFAAVELSRPFRWFIVMAAPLAEINASSRGLLRRLSAQSLGIGLAALMVSLFMLRRAIRPLRLLLPKISALADMDFSSPQKAVPALDLPLARNDEVGDLARSFSAMGEKLRVNIQALMESLAAQERMRGELDAAREIQRGILPPPELAPNIFGVSSSAMLVPAREVGGDLYSFFKLPDGRHVFAIGDVSGKGVPAALFMAVTVTLARYTLAAESDPGAALTRINALLEAHNPQTMFVTLFLALYDPADGRLYYANGGHDQPLLVGGGAVAPLEGRSGPMVGVIPGAQYRTFSRTLKEGELCLLYTDGVTEAVDEAQEAYGEGRLRAFLEAHGAEHPKELLNGIFADVKLFRGRAAPFDDITMLAFARR
ncbi:MAG: SpoIIE family protein phosphatase [Deltaproteobacteria bacterium]|nr:SpoIIE family protein phosphatase [Deltaproteobacteria bacterium]